jgi:hypothetical protein
MTPAVPTRTPRPGGHAGAEDDAEAVESVWPEPPLPATAKERNRIRNHLVFLALAMMVAQALSCWSR